MVFHSKRDGFRWAITAFVFCIYSVVAALIYFIQKDLSAIYGLGSVWALLFIFIVWILPATTKYTFFDDHLLCQSIGFKKRIPYSAFKKIEPSNGLYAGWKMSTAWKCLVLHYNKYDELLISPAKEEEFIKMFDEKKAQFSELN